MTNLTATFTVPPDGTDVHRLLDAAGDWHPYSIQWEPDKATGRFENPAKVPTPAAFQAAIDGAKRAPTQAEIQTQQEVAREVERQQRKIAARLLLLTETDPAKRVVLQEMVHS